MFFCVFHLCLLQFFYIRHHRNSCVVSTGLKPSSPVLLQQWHKCHHNCWLPGLFFLVWRRKREEVTGEAPLLIWLTLLKTKPYATKMRVMRECSCSCAPVLHCPVFVPHEKLTLSCGGSSVFTQTHGTVMSICSQQMKKQNILVNMLTRLTGHQKGLIHTRESLVLWNRSITQT